MKTRTPRLLDSSPLCSQGFALAVAGPRFFLTCFFLPRGLPSRVPGLPCLDGPISKPRPVHVRQLPVPSVCGPILSLGLCSVSRMKLWHTLSNNLLSSVHGPSPMLYGAHLKLLRRSRLFLSFDATREALPCCICLCDGDCGPSPDGSVSVTH